MRMVSLILTHAGWVEMDSHINPKVIITPGSTSVSKARAMASSWRLISKVWPHKASYIRWACGPSTASAPTQWSGSAVRDHLVGIPRVTSRSGSVTHFKISTQRRTRPISHGRIPTHLNSHWSKRKSWCESLKTMRISTFIEKSYITAERDVLWRW